MIDLNLQHIASEGGICQAGNRTDLILCFPLAVFEFLMTEPFLHQLFGYLDTALIVLQDCQHTLTADGCNHTLQLSNTAFSCIISNQEADHFIIDFQLRCFQTVFLDLLRHQMTLGNLDFLQLGIGAELDDFQTVTQRIWYILQIICRCDKEYLA